MRIALTIFSLVSLFVSVGCSSEKVSARSYKTKYVFVLVVDGPRFSETWGDPFHANIPYMDSILSKEGVVYTNFSNEGPTYTVSGHTAIATGYYQEMNNAGTELPDHPTIFQAWLASTGKASSQAWLVASKDKLQILSNSSDPSWVNKFAPSTNCGVNGSGQGSGYREDSLTFLALENVLSQNHPHLLFVNFREPDFSGHQSNWMNYLKGIKDTDRYVYQVWQYIQSDPFYKDQTTLFVTNDHGRHLDSVADGFPSHGDGCEGCRHIFLYAFGPDFKKNKVVDVSRDLTDIHATIIELMGLKYKSSQGEIMTEMFN
ncbi:MAG: alkaline phosphatase family protein [Flavobacteriia bacterium]|jgi:hypothetical protein